MIPTATIEQWTCRRADNACRIEGRVFGDLKGRFNDGARIVTSSVVVYDAPSGIVVTNNSVYQLGIMRGIR